MHVTGGTNEPSSRGVLNAVMRKDLVAIEVVEVAEVEVVGVKSGKIPFPQPKERCKKRL